MIVNCQWIARMGLAQFLSSLDPATETVEAANVEDAVRAASDGKRFDLCLLDFQMPGQEPIAVLRAIREAAPKIPILIVTAGGSRRLALEAVEKGASGFVPTSSTPEEMTRALQRVCEGDIWLPAGLRDMPTEVPRGLAEQAGGYSLPESNPAISGLTPRQRQVLELIATGKRNVDIAEILEISPRTVQIHVSTILKLLKVSNRTEAALLALGREAAD
ncbi:MAG: response regulator transcription factor [Alphaproteobacteria bacterium]|nr:response regulator transcription factor [Alphaproteobacteria bacterium]